MKGEPLLKGELPRDCTMCGLRIGQPEWDEMELIGYQDDPDDPERERLEMRNCGCGTTIALVVAKPSNMLMGARSLEELMDILLKLKEKDVQDLGEVNLPTFGGEVPSALTNVWSWDDTRLLVGARMELLRIVPR